MKILITGATGFLGRNLVKYLDQFDDELILTDKPPYLFDQQVRESWWMNKVIYHCDLDEEIHRLEDRIDGIDTIVHLANLTRIGPSWAAYPDYYRTNIASSHSLFETCQRRSVKRFIYISSSSVYGNTESQSEDTIPCPTNPYAVSKLAAEWALRVQAQKGNTELIIVRPFTMYGDFMDWGKNSLVIAQFLDAWEKGHPLMLHGGGEQSRDFLHSSDAVVGLKTIIDYGRAGEVYNLGSGTSIKIKDIADAISSKQVITPHRVGPVMSTRANIDKLKTLGFQPQKDLFQWLTSYMEARKIKLNQQ
jgi:nucleoside-diphosphate-sugar epimerase